MPSPAGPASACETRPTLRACDRTPADKWEGPRPEPRPSTDRPSDLVSPARRTRRRPRRRVSIAPPTRPFRRPAGRERRYACLGLPAYLSCGVIAPEALIAATSLAL